ncbi:chitotriosidase-1 isoform X1 [Brachionus plicatilis]|uniref:Chitotriosidase-1 isoform X1 n=1 Tax=Brachionus plicatilis TaxID=10195 RepID=A0A3M7PA83_BRAPC|nr:chitotriosidase-1 isoform X1 [Brachionus plicatilis]
MRLILAILFFGLDIIYCEQRVVCYFTNWAQYRSGIGAFQPENIDPFLCTHILFSFAKVLNNKLEPYEWNDDSTEWSRGLYERTNELRKINPNLKVMLAVGGWTMGTIPFISIVSSDAKIQSFVDSTVLYLKDRDFDGLDIVWEYPGYKTQFTKLVKALKSRFLSENLLLSAATAATKITIDTSYDLHELSNHIDFLNIMTYDYHGSWDSKTGHNAPLYARSTDNGAKATFNADFTISYYIQMGFAPEMINLGLPVYGRSFTLSNPDQNSVDSSVSGPGVAQTFTQEAGFLAYYEICSKHGTRVRDLESKVPYMYYNNQWISYDDPESFKNKASYAKFKNLGGIMFWAVDLDDFSGSVCDQGKYPLISSAKANFFSSSPSIMILNNIKTTSKSTISKSASTTAANFENIVHSNEVICYNKDGYYPDVKFGCRRFYICSFSGTKYQRIDYINCPIGTLFDKNLNVCNHQNLVKCG